MGLEAVPWAATCSDPIANRPLGPVLCPPMLDNIPISMNSAVHKQVPCRAGSLFVVCGDNL